LIYNSLSTYVAGNASVVLTETIVAATPPTPKVPVLSLTYAVTAGWKYLLLTPRASTPITGVPTGCGMWIYGDGHSNRASVRLRDSTGQTFQYILGTVTWTGWNWVTVSFVNPGYWGGANDGVWHPPMYWDTFHVWDSSQSANSGTIYFSAPTAFF